VFRGHFVASEIDVVEPKTGFTDGRGATLRDFVFFRRPMWKAADRASKPLKPPAQ
jgi:hypothetical protein